VADEVTPMQMSLGMAPEKPMRKVPKAFIVNDGAVWTYINTAVGGKKHHVIAQRRGKDSVITLCGLGGHKVKSLAKGFDPCPDCETALI